jgi:hypothetical protein
MQVRQQWLAAWGVRPGCGSYAVKQLRRSADRYHLQWTATGVRDWPYEGQFLSVISGKACCPEQGIGGAMLAVIGHS